MKCRVCGSEAEQVFLDLGHQPPSNAYLTESHLGLPEVTFPLRVYVCNECWLVQLPAHAKSNELFTDSYAYFSSVSSTWVDHARQYVEMVVQRFDLGRESFVIEVASNDGYLLQFVHGKGIRCLGVEPTESTANKAREHGIQTVKAFFGTSLAQQLIEQHGHADLLVGNNVLAHVPDLNDFVAAVATALSPNGIATFEFPHLMQLVRGKQFDTVYHEHYSYLALTTVKLLLESHGLLLFDVEELSTHGGSLRVFVKSKYCSKYLVSDSVTQLLADEAAEGMQTVEYYAGFQPVINRIKNDLVTFLVDLIDNGESVCGYGAAAKGNTLLNYAGIRPDLLPYVCDAATSKQGKFLPGSHIPIVAPDMLRSCTPSIVLVLPWNIAGEIVSKHSYIRDWKGRFITAIPKLETLGTVS